MGMLRKYGILLGLAILLTACQPSSPSFLISTSPIASHEAKLYREVLIEAISIFILITGALIWILIRYRNRGEKALPPQIYGKVSWVLIPVFLIVALDGMDFVWMFQTMKAVAVPQHAVSDLNIRVVGHRWWWEFDYMDQKIATANELHIPVGTTVQVALESVDVIHSFWVPQISGKTDVIPGQHNTMWLQGNEVGEFLGQCAEFCGTEHALMRFKVIVQSQEDFNAWVTNQQKPAYLPQTPDEEAGYKEVTGACAACHSLDPSEIDTKKVGPNLSHLFSRSTFAGGSFDLNEENLKNWLKDTQTMKPGNDMEISILPKTRDQIASYLMHLK
jgi:cytochrome c oxidase subunit 2